MDVGFRNTGIVAYNTSQEYFCRFCYIPTQTDETAPYKTPDNVRCCREIYTQIFEFLELVGIDRIRVITAELPHSGGKSARAHAAMGMSVAVIACVLAELKRRHCKVHFEPVTPLESKRLVRKKGKVSKEDIQNLIEKRYGKILPRKKYIREHIADAMAAVEVLRAKFSPKYF
jgi:Holliday junction resolvasome RuvABC endonuclease subunit